MSEMVGAHGIVGVGLCGRITLPGGITISLTGEALKTARKAKLEAVLTTEGTLVVTASRKVTLAVDNFGRLEVSTEDMASTVTVKVSPSLEGIHDPTRSYERLSVVCDGATNLSYISKVDVPTGIALSNSEYWQPYAPQPTIIDVSTGATYAFQVIGGELLAKQMT